MGKVENIQLEKIKIGPRERSFNSQNQIKESIEKIGLLHPIVVSEDYKLICGYHRLEACKSLGLKEIQCNIVPLKGLEKQLAEIDENIINNPLTYLEQAVHFKRSKELYELINPETKKGGDRKSINATKRRFDVKGSFTKNTAKKLRKSERSIQRLVEVGEKINKDVVSKLLDTRWEDSAKDLLKLIKYGQDEQVKIVNDFKAGIIKTIPKKNEKKYSREEKVENVEFFSLLESLTVKIKESVELCQEIALAFNKEKQKIKKNSRKADGLFKKLTQNKIKLNEKCKIVEGYNLKN